MMANLNPRVDIKLTAIAIAIDASIQQSIIIFFNSSSCFHVSIIKSGALMAKNDSLRTPMSCPLTQSTSYI